MRATVRAICDKLLNFDKHLKLFQLDHASVSLNFQIQNEALNAALDASSTHAVTNDLVIPQKH